MLIRFVFLTGFIWLFAGFVFTFLSFRAFDRALKLIKETSEEEWLAIGQPIGFFWIPPGTVSTIDGGFVRGELYRKWGAEPFSLQSVIAGHAYFAKLRTFKRIGSLCFMCGLSQFLISMGLVFLD